MSEILSELKNSNAWDQNYNLPLVPQHNNPWLYFAYAMKIINDHNKKPWTQYEDIYSSMSQYRDLCEIEPGLFYRKPDGSGGLSTSHDELMGLAWISRLHAKRILDYLKTSRGLYNTNKVTGHGWFRFWLYRFVFLKPFLKACADENLSFLDKLLWASFVWIDSFLYKTGDEGGRLRIWIMLDHMKKHCPKTTGHWVHIMQKKHSLNPKACFRFYLAECPWFYKYASDKFIPD